MTDPRRVIENAITEWRIHNGPACHCGRTMAEFIQDALLTKDLLAAVPTSDAPNGTVPTLDADRDAGDVIAERGAEEIERLRADLAERDAEIERLQSRHVARTELIDSWVQYKERQVRQRRDLQAALATALGLPTRGAAPIPELVEAVAKLRAAQGPAGEAVVQLYEANRHLHRRNREYGRASATIGQLRAEVARLRTETRPAIQVVESEGAS